MRSLKTHCKILEDCRSCGNLGWARANVAAATRALLGLTSALLVDQIGKKCEILRLFSWSWNRDIFRIFTVHQHQHRPPQQLSRNCRFFYVSPCIHSRPSYTWYFLYFSKCRPIECPMQAEGDKKLKYQSSSHSCRTRFAAVGVFKTPTAKHVRQEWLLLWYFELFVTFSLPGTLFGPKLWQI